MCPDGREVWYGKKRIIMGIDWVNIAIVITLFLILDFIMAWLVLRPFHGMNIWDFFKYIFSGWKE